MIQIVASFAPILLCALCLPFLFRRAGFHGKTVWLTWLPAIVAGFSFAGAVIGERSLQDGGAGEWTLAAVLVALTVLKWPTAN